MQKIIFICLSLCFLFACKETPANNQQSSAEEPVPTDSGAAQDDPDLVAIDSVIHGFYAWYDQFLRDEARDINFINDRGKHLALDPAKLDQYFANLQASGFISDAFVQHEKERLKKCEVLWQKESKDEVPSCLDADRFFCAQDWELAYWTTAAVSVEGLGSAHVVATLSGMEGGSPRGQKIELTKENGQWKIVRIPCDMGVGE